MVELILVRTGDKFDDQGLNQGSSAEAWINVGEASGNKLKLNLRKPYTPSFNKIPARRTEPTVGASTCASGNHT